MNAMSDRWLIALQIGVAVMLTSALWKLTAMR
jgi:hypothetical protein